MAIGIGTLEREEDEHSPRITAANTIRAAARFVQTTLFDKPEMDKDDFRLFSGLFGKTIRASADAYVELVNAGVFSKDRLEYMSEKLGTALSGKD